MKSVRASLLRFAGLFSSKARRDSEFNDELESHLQMHIDDNLRAGMSQEEARRMARLSLGGIEATREAYLDRGSVPVIEHLTQDVRFAIRQLRKNPGFTLAAMLVLALGIAASVAIFAFVDAALLQPLPFREPNRLVGVTETIQMMGRANLSYQDYLDWKKLNQTLQSLDVITGMGYLLKTPDGAKPVQASRVTEGFFRTLGASPILGRDFRPGDDQKDATKVTVLSYTAWMKYFSGRPDIVGQPVILSGAPYEVIGVMPKGFMFAPRPRTLFWTPILPDGSCEKRRSCHNLEGIARLKDGVSVETALANMTAIASQLEKQYPDSNRGQGASVVLLAELVSGGLKPILLAVLGGAGLLLLIACVNVASLLLVRSESRRREFAVRSALGASAARLASQFVTEGVVLIIVSCALGLVGASWAIKLLIASIPNDISVYLPFLPDVGLHSRVVLFAAALSAIVGGLLALTPIVHAGFSKMREGLTEGTRGSSGMAWRKLGSKLVIVELAITMVLLVCAGLLGKSLSKLMSVDVGFRPDHLATITVAAPDAGYTKDEQIVAMSRQVISKIAALPGVQSAAITGILPVSFNGNTTWIRIKGKPYNGEHNEVNYRDVGAGYFETIGARLASGRYFADNEDPSKPMVMIVNQALARKYFPGENPIGQQIGDTSLSPKSVRTIVGVIEDVKEGSLESEIWPATYYPFNQDPGTYFEVVARTSQAPESVLPLLPKVVHQVDPELGAFDEKTINSYINNSQTAYMHRSSAWLVGGFATLALILSIVGLYGVIAYSVSQRTREIGVRMALGARSTSVYRLILEEAGWLAMIGIVLGAALSIASARMGGTLLFQVQAWDVPTLVGVAAVLAAAALFASYIPARRAASVNPVEALRTE